MPLVSTLAVVPLLLALADSTPGRVAPPPPGTTGAVHHGRRGELEVRPPRVEGASAELRVDGVLDEPVWQTAARLTGFSQFQPADGLPATDSTEVLVWYSPTAIHFGVRAFAPPGTVNATLADRDRITADDHVMILLSTFDDARQAMAFAVNPLGIQLDGTLVETGNMGGGGFGDNTARARELVDPSADFVYASKGRVTAAGYEVELRIPFKSLRYQPTDVQRWGNPRAAPRAAVGRRGLVGAGTAWAGELPRAGRAPGRAHRPAARAGARPHADGDAAQRGTVVGRQRRRAGPRGTTACGAPTWAATCAGA
jgi:hypothetical protein